MAALLADVRRALHIVVPAAVGNACEYLPVLIGGAIVGHLHADGDASAADLDAMMVARAFFDLVGMAPGFGIITPLRTLCPQAVGASQLHLLGVYLQRALLVVLLSFGAVMPLLLSAERLLPLVGVPAETARRAAPYCVRMAPSYLGVVGMSAVQRVYQALGLNYTNLAITAVVCACAPGIQWLLCRTCGLGYLGSAWATSVYNCLYIFVQVPVLVLLGHSAAVTPKPLRTLLAPSEMSSYLRLMLPGLIICCSEWWVMELATLLSGKLRRSDLVIGSFAIVKSVQSLALMAWIGLAVAASVMVGTHIGAGRLADARRAAVAVVLVGAVLSCATAAFLVIFARSVADFFTTSNQMDELAASIFPLLALVVVLDAFGNGFGGVCSGLGLQRYAAAAQLTGYYCVGMPIGLAVAFGVMHAREKGVFWLYAGVAISMLAAALLQLLALLCCDWKRAVAEAMQRIGPVDDTTGYTEHLAYNHSYNDGYAEADGVPVLRAIGHDAAVRSQHKLLDTTDARARLEGGTRVRRGDNRS